MSTVLIKGGTVVGTTGQRKADILVENGVILSVGESLSGGREVDASGYLIFPGLIDCHVHFREPGFPDKATMHTEAAAARAGGVTTVCEMPNTDPPTVTLDAFKDKMARAANISDCDIRFFFGATQTPHLDALKQVWTSDLRDRCAGLKLYFDHSTGDQKADTTVLEQAFELCARLGIVCVGHCEDPETNAAAYTFIQKKVDQGDLKMDVSLHSLMRPVEAEEKSVAFAIDLARKHGTRFHVAHLSTKEGLDHVRQAKSDGLPVTCEVAPHHLLLSVDDYETLGPLGKMNPPLRTAEHGTALLQGIKDGTVDCIATDHAPHTLEEKQGENPLEAPSGVPGVETMLPLLLTLASAGTLSYEDIARLCFENPNQIFSLGRHGIEEGAPAKLTIVDPSKTWTIHGKDVHHKCKWTPYEGWNVTGRVMDVMSDV